MRPDDAVVAAKIIKEELTQSLAPVCALLARANRVGLSVDFKLGIDPATKEGVIEKLEIRGILA